MRPAAVFDLDGTLIRGTSAERLLLRHLLREGVVGWRGMAAAGALVVTLPWAGWTRAVRRNKRWLTGVPVDQVLSRLDAFLDEVVAPQWCGTMVARMEALRAQGVAPFLLSGSPEFLAEAVARRLGMEGWLGTPMEVVDGRFTGRLDGVHLFAEAKRHALAAMARDHELDLGASWGFADHATDVPFLERFGHPVAVAADAELRRVAGERGWEVVECGAPGVEPT